MKKIEMELLQIYHPTNLFRLVEIFLQSLQYFAHFFFVREQIPLTNDQSYVLADKDKTPKTISRICNRHNHVRGYLNESKN